MKTIRAGILATALLALSGGIASANLITNGSFERAGDVAPYPIYFVTPLSAEQIAGWTTGTDNVDWVGDYWLASTGVRSVDLSGDDAGSVAQTIATVVGHTYVLEFDLSGNPDGGPWPKTMNVELSQDGATVPFNTFNFTLAFNGARTHANMLWQHQAICFGVLSEATVVRLVSTTSGLFGPVVDNVSVREDCCGAQQDCDSEIRGRKFEDLDLDGVLDPGEPLLSGWEIRLVGTGYPLQTRTTGLSGEYEFADLPIGLYVVCETTKPGWIHTTEGQGCHVVSIVAGADREDQDYGNVRCLDPECIRPPQSMVAWWPFDEPLGTTSHDIWGKHGTWIAGPVSAPGKVKNAISLESLADVVKVNDNPLFHAGVVSFSIDAWVKLHSPPRPRVILDKQALGSVPTGGKLAIDGANRLEWFMADGTTTQTIVHPTPLTPDAWHHVAIVYDVTTNLVTLYVDAAPNAPVVRTVGNGTTSTPLWIGNGVPSTEIDFKGEIDELEIFGAALSAQTILDLYEADSDGKCRESCYVPSYTAVNVGATFAPVPMQMCNYDWSQGPKDYLWTLAGLPTGTASPPTGFDYTAGPLTVAAGNCEDLVVGPYVLLPTDLVVGKHTDFQLSVMEKVTRRCTSCTGQVVRSGKIIFGHPPEPVGIPGGATGHVKFEIQAAEAAGLFDYRVRHLASIDSDRASLNGQAPGVAMTGTIALPGGAGFVELDVPVAYPRDGVVFPYDEVVLAMDVDGDGDLDDAQSIAVFPLSASVVGVPPAGASGTVGPGRATPNPFRGEVRFHFELARPGHVDLRVFDVAGRLVRSLDRGPRAAGAHAVPWDGLDDAGRPAPAGIYFLRLGIDSAVSSLRVIRLGP